MTKFSSNTAITRTRIALSVSMVLVLGLGVPRSWSSQAGEPVDSAVAYDVSARLSEQNFWSSVPVPRTEMRLIIFRITDASQLRDRPNFDVLAILPELNSFFQYRSSGRTVVLSGHEEGWRTWSYPGGSKVAIEQYATLQMTRFADFVAHAQRIEHTITIDTDPTTIFQIDPQLRVARLAQIEFAAKQLFKKRPLRLIVADFSSRTEQIYGLAPTLDEMVTFSVLRSADEKTTVEVGRETPLKSVRADLRQRIEANSSVLVIK